MHIRHITAVAITALALTACTPTADSSSDSSAKPKATKSKTQKADPSKLDDAGEFACDDFAKDYKAATTTDARLDLAHKVNKWAPKSQTNRIADTGKILSNGAGGSDGSWQLAADTFAQACLDAGWDG